MAKIKRGQAGNYQAPVDFEGMDPEMQKTLRTPQRRPVMPPHVDDGLGTMNQVESDYLKSRGGVENAKEAIRRARKANR